MISRAEEILKNTDVKYSRNVDIAGLSTMGIHSVAALVAEPDCKSRLVMLLKQFHSYGIPYRVVGGMSNIMPRSEYYSGVLVKTRNIAAKSVAENKITAECGARLSQIVRTLTEYHLGAMAQLYHIPGTLGASVRGNAGAHGLELSDVFESAEVYLVSEDRTVTFTKPQMNFGYRTSQLKLCDGVVLSATLNAAPRDPSQTKAEIEHFHELRKSQPRGVCTLGSTFKRANGISAGWYIDQCGLKGFSVGGAFVSEIHAGFIVNRGSATVNDVLNLIDIVKKRVFSQFGILLEEEIDYL